MITEEALADFSRHVLEQYPREACGVLVDGNYIRCTNIAPEPHQHFQIAAQELAGIAATHGPVQAILHSHPFDHRSPPKWPAEWPSHHDMQQWLKGDLPWGIVGTEGENITEVVWLNEEVTAPVEGRPFVSGVWDCYSTVRDWYRLNRNIVLPNYPRGMEWWERGLDHYSENFAKAGFIEIEREDLQVGDAVLMQVRSQVPNHAAVITGSNEITHHLFHRYSGRDRFDRWERLVCKYLRYKGET